MTLQYPPGNAVCLSVSAQQMVGFIRGGKMADCTRVSRTTPRCEGMPSHLATVGSSQVLMQKKDATSAFAITSYCIWPRKKSGCNHQSCNQ